MTKCYKKFFFFTCSMLIGVFVAITRWNTMIDRLLSISLIFQLGQRTNCGLDLLNRAYWQHRYYIWIWISGPLNKSTLMYEYGYYLYNLDVLRPLCWYCHMTYRRYLPFINPVPWPDGIVKCLLNVLFRIQAQVSRSFGTLHQILWIRTHSFGILFFTYCIVGSMWFPMQQCFLGSLNNGANNWHKS